MLRLGPYRYKEATEPDEFAQIHRLNYRMFAEELAQHPADGSGRLVDKFHGKSRYFIAVQADGQVVGMVSVHAEPPFSVAARLPDASALRQPGLRALEVRLLAIEPRHRHSAAFAGLLWMVHQHAIACGSTHLVMSGVVERVPLYASLGFLPLGPAVGCGRASFVPMQVRLADIEHALATTLRRWRRRIDAPQANGVPRPAARIHGTRPRCLVRLLPGPVSLSAAVQGAFAEPPLYHRSAAFVTLFQRVRTALGQLVNRPGVAIFPGGGTLANDVVAAMLAATPGAAQGVVLNNGEFGRRLVDHALRAGLRPQVLEWPWGQPWSLQELAVALRTLPRGSFVWGVHHETSTGMLNDLPALVQLATQRGLRVCVDAVSSLGAVPLDLRDVHLATAASGKALGAVAGLALVFADPATLAGVNCGGVPACFDLPTALAEDGPPTTIASPLVAALAAVLAGYATPALTQQRFAELAALSRLVRDGLRQAGFTPVADDAHASPVVTTFAPPRQETSAAFVARMAAAGYEIGGNSRYLADRRCVQLATMGAVEAADVAACLDWLATDSTQRTHPS